VLVAVGPLSAAATQPADRHLVLVDARTGAVDKSFPDLVVSALVADGHGGWFASGVSYGALVHLNAGARVDQRWHAQLPNGADARRLIRVGGRLYVSLARQIAAVDAATGKRLWLSERFSPGKVSGGVILNALAANRTTVFVGGDFSGVGRSARKSVVALHARDGRLLPWRMPQVMQPSYDVNVLTVAGLRLYVGGVTSPVAVSTRTGKLLDWAPAFTADDTTAIAVVERTVVVGGTFGFAAYDARTAKPQTWTRRLGGSASVFAASGTTLYLGANLRSSFGAQDGDRNNLGAVNVAAGRFLDWGPNLARFVTVRSIAPSGGKVLVAGSFTASIG